MTIDETTELVIPVDKYTPKITSADVAKIVPLDVRPVDTTGQAANGLDNRQVDTAGRMINRIADRGFGLWYDNVLKKTTVGQLAESAQETLKTDIEVTPTGDGVSHKVSVQVEAFTAQAVVKYTGWVKAQVRLGAAGTDIIFKEKIFENKDLLITHTSNRHQDLSMISMGWSW